MSERDWKQHHANEAEKVFDHPLMQQVMDEYADNMGFKLEGLPKYGLMKVASYAAILARAYALGFDPDLLRYTSEEANSELLRTAAEATLRGVPVYMLEGSRPTPEQP